MTANIGSPEVTAQAGLINIGGAELDVSSKNDGLLASALYAINPRWQANRQAEAGTVALKAVLDGAQSAREAVPTLTPSQAVCFAAGVILPPRQADNVRAVFQEAQSRATDIGPITPLDGPTAEADVMGSSTADCEQLRAMWASLIAAESTATGSFRRRTKTILQSMDAPMASAFQRLCSCTLWTGSSHGENEGYPLLVVDSPASATYDDGLLTFEEVLSLAAAGLLSATSWTSFSLAPGERDEFECGGQRLAVINRSQEEHTYTLSGVLMLDPGQELARICEPDIVPCENLGQLLRNRINGQCPDLAVGEG